MEWIYAPHRRSRYLFVGRRVRFEGTDCEIWQVPDGFTFDGYVSLIRLDGTGPTFVRAPVEKLAFAAEEP